MIQAKNIYKHYGKLEVIKGVSLDIRKEEIVAIVGPSGAGKTTLLQIMSTLDTMTKNDSSQLIINGIDIKKYSEKNLAKLRNEHIGFIFQFHQLLPEFTAMENVFIPALIKKTPKATAAKNAKKLLDFLGLSHRYDHKPAELSGGEQQRVAVARALINNPAVIFADEPSGNLDSENAEELHHFFFELREKFGQTFVMVTHNTALAAMADRTLTMVDGNIIPN